MWFMTQPPRSDHWQLIFWLEDDVAVTGKKRKFGTRWRLLTGLLGLTRGERVANLCSTVLYVHAAASIRCMHRYCTIQSADRGSKKGIEQQQTLAYVHKCKCMNTHWCDTTPQLGIVEYSVLPYLRCISRWAWTELELELNLVVGGGFSEGSFRLPTQPHLIS